jgi:hypothetical protein
MLTAKNKESGMARLTKFTDIETKTDVFVNPILVRLVRAGPKGSIMIEFDERDSILVEANLESVVRDLDDALRS